MSSHLEYNLIHADQDLEQFLDTAKQYFAHCSEGYVKMTNTRNVIHISKIYKCLPEGKYIMRHNYDDNGYNHHSACVVYSSMYNGKTIYIVSKYDSGSCGLCDPDENINDYLDSQQFSILEEPIHHVIKDIVSKINNSNLFISLTSVRSFVTDNFETEENDLVTQLDLKIHSDLDIDEMLRSMHSVEDKYESIDIANSAYELAFNKPEPFKKII